MGPNSPAVKLPIVKTVSAAYASLAFNLGTALRICWVWMLLLTVVAYLAGQMQFSFMGDLQKPDEAMAGLSEHVAKMQAFSLLHSVVYLIAGSAIAVPWHRLLLLNEQPGMSGSNVADSTVWRYAGNTILVVAIALAGVVPAFVLLAFLSGSKVGILIGLAGLYVAAAFVGLRLWLVLPARAVGRNDLRLKDIWRGSQGNVWRLFWGLVLCVAPGIVIVQALMYAWGVLPGPGIEGSSGAELISFTEHMRAVFPIVMAVSTPIGILLGFLMIGFMSFAFRHLFASADVRAPH